MIYFCKECNYTTKRKDGFQKHLKSKRHLKMINGYDEKYKYECKFCSKKYIHCAGLSRHKKTCKIKNQEEKKNKDDIIAKDREIEKLRKMLEKKDEQMRKQQAEDKKEKAEMRQTISTLAKNKGNTQNNTFNIQVFLNEKCKNAMPLLEFVKDLQFKLTDINPERPASSIESLSKCITDKLDDMEETERPVHCTDQKRLVFHVKDASGWTKDINNKKINNAIGAADCRHQGAWIKKAKADDWVNKKDDTYHLNMINAMGKFSDNPKKAKMKIKRAIAKHTTFPKNWTIQKPAD